MVIGYGNNLKVVEFLAKCEIKCIILVLLLANVAPWEALVASLTLVSFVLFVMFLQAKDGKVKVDFTEDALILNYKYDRIDVSYKNIASIKDEDDSLIINVAYLGEQRIRMNTNDREYVVKKIKEKTKRDLITN